MAQPFIFSDTDYRFQCRRVTFLTSCPPIFYVLHPFLRVLEAGDVVSEVVFVVLIPASVSVASVYTLNTPSLFLVPRMATLPTLPVLLKLRMGNRSIIPDVTMPTMVLVVCSPILVYIKIKCWNLIVISPAMIIIL